MPVPVYHSAQQDRRIFISFCFLFQTFLEKGGGLKRESRLPVLTLFLGDMIF